MASKQSPQDLKPWEQEEGRKRNPERGDGIPSKTGMSARLPSKPKAEGHEYLDMYIMLKQKERTEKYGETLYKRQQRIKEEWEDVKNSLLKMEESLPEVPKGGLEGSEKTASKSRQKSSPKMPKNVKTVDWNY